MLKELSKTLDVELLVSSRLPLSSGQRARMQGHTVTVVRVPPREVSLRDGLWVSTLVLTLRVPYHCAFLGRCVRRYPDIARRIRAFPGIIYSAGGYWGTLIAKKKVSNWILDQFDALVFSTWNFVIDGTKSSRQGQLSYSKRCKRGW